MDIQLGLGGRAHVRDRGAGPPLLLLHGNPDTSQLWDGVVERLASRHRCLAADLPGFGQSDVPRAFETTLGGVASWVDDLVMSLGIAQPLDLVVHDFGGIFGIAWAVAHPEKVRRLAIINTVFFPEYRWHFWARVWRTRLLGELSFALTTRWGLAREMRRGSNRLPVSHVRAVFDAMTPAMHRMVLRLYRAIDPECFAAWQEGLRALLGRVPSIVLWGDRDPYIDSRFAERFGAGRVVHFEHAGHWLPVEEAAAVAQQLDAFFD
jgi:pimeloyl-ACP methyl ester carboxylesterase